MHHLERPPASTAVQVAALFRPGYLVEIEAWAVVAEYLLGLFDGLRSEA